jgi:ribA/ribD-fused uncharacterized protein
MSATWVLGFYGHNASQKYGCFSNFYTAPLTFVVPEEFCAFPVSLRERTIACDFTEKAIMACKAAAMGDRRSYEKIAASNASPAIIKGMGRKVQGFNDDIWKSIECSVAYEVVYQKFLKVDEVRHVLLSTEDWVIAEATRNDSNWGIGLDVGDKLVHHPAQWPGTNMLGWALMETRTALRLAAGSSPSPQVAEISHTNASDMSGNKEEQSTGSICTEQEKSFLKIVKKCRAILKLEDMLAAGTALDKMQMKKLDEKYDAFLELSNLEKDLPIESDLRSKNQDLLIAMTGYLAKN